MLTFAPVKTWRKIKKQESEIEAKQLTLLTNRQKTAIKPLIWGFILCKLYEW